MAAIGASKAAAERQKEEYFALAPWEDMKNQPGGKIFANQRLDLRMLIQPFARDSAVVAAVFANQDGLPTIGSGGGRERQWRCIGTVAVESGANLPVAVARQRKLIEAWADELCHDFQTDAKIFKRGPLAPPIRLAWALPASGWKKMVQPSYQGELNEVAMDTPIDPTVRCGFFGSGCRSVKGAKGGFRFVKVELK